MIIHSLALTSGLSGSDASRLLGIAQIVCVCERAIAARAP